MRVHYLEVLVGAIVLFIAGSFLSYAYYSSGSGVPYTFHLNAQFERVDGIMDGSDIKLRGVKVGEVSELKIIRDERLMASLVLSFEDDFHFPVDSLVEIASDGLMGPKYIAIIPGESDVFMKAGEAFTYTQPSVSLESLIAKFVFSDNGAKNEVKA